MMKGVSRACPSEALCIDCACTVWHVTIRPLCEMPRRLRQAGRCHYRPDPKKEQFHHLALASLSCSGHRSTES